MSDEIKNQENENITETEEKVEDTGAEVKSETENDEVEAKTEADEAGKNANMGTLKNFFKTIGLKASIPTT